MSERRENLLPDYQPNSYIKYRWTRLKYVYPLTIYGSGFITGFSLAMATLAPDRLISLIGITAGAGAFVSATMLMYENAKSVSEIQTLLSRYTQTPQNPWRLDRLN